MYQFCITIWIGKWSVFTLRFLLAIRKSVFFPPFLPVFVLPVPVPSCSFCCPFLSCYSFFFLSSYSLLFFTTISFYIFFLCLTCCNCISPIDPSLLFSFCPFICSSCVFSLLLSHDNTYWPPLYDRRHAQY